MKPRAVESEPGVVALPDRTDATATDLPGVLVTIPNPLQ